ncbi:MAG: XRE family transcriptional regulator [Acidobacteriota bacterium]|nr:XRE family transcriptional regulator [Acidobacteriota bacterium]
MRIGTPGFVAARLTEAREARGLTQTSLAELTGLKAQSICHYEQGRQSPSPEALDLLRTSLDVPPRFFLRPASIHGAQDIFFSIPARTDRALRLQAERRLGWLKEIAAYVGCYVDLPAVCVPRLPGPPEDAANEVRRISGIGMGAVGSMPAVLENLGCIVAVGGPALSQWDGGIPWLMAGTGSYSAACQLGHLVQDADETEAARFARAFLLPAEAFAGDVWAPTADALLTLRKQWHCSIRVMIHRCEDLAIFDAAQARRALVKLSRRGWDEDESCEDGRPTLLARSLQLLIESGVRDGHAILHDLGLNGKDVEDLAGLPEGFLAAAVDGAPVELKLRGAVPDLVRT